MNFGFLWKGRGIRRIRAIRTYMNSHLEKLKKHITSIKLVIKEIPYTKDYEFYEFNKHLFKIPPAKCPECGSTKFWLRVDGDYACMQCRPPIEDLVWEFTHGKN